jgi:ribose 5-phosphate isomerase A
MNRGEGPIDAKKAAGESAAEYVRDGMRIGLGTGSTVYWTLVKIGEMVKDGLQIQAIATSQQTEKLALQLGIPLLEPSGIVHKLDLAIDGADEVSANFDLIKGGGGALLREKMIAAFSSRFIVVVDHSKCVDHLGKFPLPVEVVPFGWELTSRHIAHLGCKPTLRRMDEAPFVTDNGNYILDCQFSSIPNPSEINTELNRVPGVVEHGLFVDMADRVIVGHSDGTVQKKLTFKNTC